MPEIKVKTPSGAVIAGIQAEGEAEWATLFPANNKDDGDLQGPAVAVKVGPGTPYEVVE